MFKFIHAADIHLDSPLKGLERYEGAPVEEIRGAARRALENLIDLALTEQVSFVLIAGDFYDGDWRDYNTGQFFIKQISRLRDAAIPVYLIAGNHDAASRLTRHLRLPEHVHLFPASEAGTACVPDLDVAIHGQSFATQAVKENLAVAYPSAVPGLLNIGLLHTCATSQEHERYAPCSVDDLRLKDYDYWALGHVHQRQELSSSPRIVFSGNLQGRHIRESGPKGCLLVSVGTDRQMQTEFRPLDVLRWERAVIDVSASGSIEEVLDQVYSKLEYLRSAADGRLLATRVELTGATPLHRVLQARKPHWMQEIRSVATQAGSGEIWVEKIRLATTEVSTGVEGMEIAEAALEEMKTLFLEVRQETIAGHLWKDEMEELAKKLPDELKSLLRTEQSDWLNERISEAESLLLSELLNREET
ncbi:MAG: DNA repair exonuclease [Planctomycetaceae bacterium]|nr:DNA repair exonuclease [Planctomycetaceae bacterium]